MKTTKSILTVSAVVGLFAANLFAAEPLLTPRLYRARAELRQTLCGLMKETF